MPSISASDGWRTSHPGAILGLLELAEVNNTNSSAMLNQRKREVEARLRERYKGFTRKDLLRLPVMADYERYYRRFDKTYHVLLQVESLAIKGKNLPSVSPLVDSNFIAEVETLVLTAGHDVARLEGPILMDVSRAGDQITRMNGASKAIRPGDMVMRDENGICCSIIYGQDNRSPISSGTSRALYVAYAPAGVSGEIVEIQLEKIEENVRLFSPSAVVVNRQLLKA